MKEPCTHQLDRIHPKHFHLSLTSETVDEVLLRTRLLDVSVGPEKDSGLTGRCRQMLWSWQTPP